MLQKLRIKFVAVIMLVSTVLLCCCLSLIYHYTASNIEEEQIQMMQSVNDSVGPGGFSPDAFRPNDRLHYFVLTQAPNGNLLVTANNSFDLSNEQLLIEMYRIAASEDEQTGVIEEYSLRWLRRFSPIGESYVFADISEGLAALRTLRISCITIGGVALIALLVISMLLTKLMLRPVELAWQQQKQFVADASHELKTPLTVIMTNTELLASPDYGAQEKMHLVQNTAEMAKRMRFLVEGLLDLARVDNGIVQSAMEAVDYSALIEQSILPFEPLFFEAGHMLNADIAPSITLKGSPTHLAQVTDILLDNAMKYSAPDTDVAVTLRSQGRHVVLCVDSMGSPLSTEDLTNIFRRFYTVDKARTGGSYGLGLSIAQGIVEEHKGKIWAESSGGHNRFYVKLPL